MPRRNRTAFLIATCLLLIGSIQSTHGQDVGVETTLQKTGPLVEKFLDQLSDVRCTEQVVQQKLNKDGHVELSEKSSYDYLVMLQGDGDDLMLNESRIELKTSTVSKKHLPLLLTNGFSSLFLVFHPYYQNSFHFASDGTETQDGRSLLRVRFSHIPGTRTPAALSVRGREYPLELSGTAWIRPESGAIVRIQTGLQTDMKDVGLRALSTDVEYGPVQLSGISSTYLFPVVATIEVQSLRQHWRNTHRFHDYTRFNVDAEQAATPNVRQQ